MERLLKVPAAIPFWLLEETAGIRKPGDVAGLHLFDSCLNGAEGCKDDHGNAGFGATDVIEKLNAVQPGIFKSVMTA
jgi:hypothetical protein